MICFAFFNTRLSLFNKISHQSFTHTTRHSAKTQHHGVILNISTEGITINRSYNPANALQDKIKYKKTKTKTTFDSFIKLEGEWAEGSQWRRYIIILKDIICHGLCMMIGFVYSLLTIATPRNWDSRSVCAPTIRQYSRDAKGTAFKTILIIEIQQPQRNHKASSSDEDQR